jgi:chemotaxis protein methyltransferase CheR
MRGQEGGDVSTTVATPGERERFRTLIGRQMGLRFDDTKLGFLSEVLQRRLTKLGRDGDSYLWELDRAPSHGELAALAGELTVGETYFFRNVEQFRALSDVVLPARLRVNRSPKVLRALSAGCSSGEEAYSIAIVARETVIDPTWNLSVRAVDLNPAALEKAARGRYSRWALRETEADTRSRWFREEGRDFLLDDGIRALVTFEQANLAADDADLWQPGIYDVIFCRNVLMYFELQQMRAVVSRIERSLAPGGYLFLGHAETLRGVSNRFQLCNSHDTFYYRLEGAAGRVEERVVAFVPRQAVSRAAPFANDTAWFEQIHSASERVAALLPLPHAECDAAAPSSDPIDAGRALDLIRQERFAEALDHIRAHCKTPADDLDLSLLEAVVLMHAGQLAAADERAYRLLEADGSKAVAHYILALNREHARHRAGAIDHHRAAAACDPLFAMPHLHLALLLRRAGQRNAARCEFARALALFEQEEATRILLFGGGFSREALMTLCQSAAAELEEQP